MRKQLGPFTFIIDRPKGRVKEWPQPDGSVKRFVYPCDYGYWPKIKGEDGEGLDAFVGDDPNGHKESFQKLNPDGTPDETKFLLGVSDKEREIIYGLYKSEVNARRVYDDWDDVQAALDTFQTKRHKTASHSHRWAYGYLPGTGYRHCACGEIEEVFPDGPAKPMAEKEKGFVRRHLGKTAAYRYGEKVADVPGDMSALVGGHDYYLARALDFRRRHPDLKAPDYYADYGDKYSQRFSHELAPNLSRGGREWVNKTRAGLQSAIEAKRAKDPEAFDELERDPDAFRSFAFGTHPRAYLEAGLRGLPFKDKVRIALTPDLKDLARPSGIVQAARTLGGLATEKTAMDPFATMNWVPSSFAGRVQSPSQIMQASQSTPALAGTQENIRMLQLAQDPFGGGVTGSPTPGVTHHRHRRHHR